MDNLVSENILLTIGRAKMYSAIFTCLYSVYDKEQISQESIEALKYLNPEIEKDIKEITVEEMNEFRGSKVFDDIPENAYPHIVSEFYRHYGFEMVGFPPDHVISFVAFMSKLVSEELQFMQKGEKEKTISLRIIQHRFLSTHMLRLLKSFAKLKPFYDLVSMDKNLLFSELKRTIRGS